MKKLLILLILPGISVLLQAQNLSVDPSQLEVWMEPMVIENQTVTLTNNGSQTISWETEIVDLTGSSYNENFELIYQVPLEESNYESIITTDGNYIYTANQSNGVIRKYDMSGIFISSFSFPAIGGFRGLCWDGTYFYGSTGMTFVYVLDFETQQVVSTIETFMGIRAITYDEVNDVFYGYNWEGYILGFDHSGAQVNLFVIEPDAYVFSGLAYDNLSPGGPYLWGYGALGTDFNLVVQYQMPGLQPTGFTANMDDILVNADDGLAGGLFISTDIVQDILALGGIVKYEWLWTVEIAEIYTWISVNPSSGTLNPNSSSDITVTFDATNVLPWYFEAEVNFTGQPGNDTATVLASMGIEGQPGMYWLEVEQNCTNALLTWETIPPGMPTDSFHIYRDDAYYATAFQSSWEDSLLTPGDSHNYTVTGYFFNGWESNATNEEVVTIAEPDSLAPTNLTFNSTSADSIVCISWENLSCLEPYYGVFRNWSVLGVTFDTCFCDTLTYPGTYNYYVSSEYYFGTYWSETLEYQWTGTGLADKQHSQLNFYPNPAHDFVVISIDKNIESIIFTNLQGTKVMEVQKPGKQKIDISNLEQGIYFIEVKTKDKSVTGKIIIH